MNTIKLFTALATIALLIGCGKPEANPLKAIYINGTNTYPLIELESWVGAQNYLTNGSFALLTIPNGSATNHPINLGQLNTLSNWVYSQSYLTNGLVWTNAPTATNSFGIRGMFSYDITNLYICVGSNSWKRAPLVGW